MRGGRSLAPPTHRWADGSNSITAKIHLELNIKRLLFRRQVVVGTNKKYKINNNGCWGEITNITDETLINKSDVKNVSNSIKKFIKNTIKTTKHYSILYTLAISPSLGGSRQHKRRKTMGTPLRSSSNDEGPSRVWMALLEQHSPSSPVFHNLRRFINAISPTAPTTGLPL